MAKTVFRIGAAAAFFLAAVSMNALSQARIMTTYAGPQLPVNGVQATSQAIDSPESVVPDGAGGFYVSSYYQNRVYRVAADGNLTVIAGDGMAGYAGDGASAPSAKLYNPIGLGKDVSGNLYIADWHNSRIRMVTPEGIITTVAGNGMAGYSGDGGPATSAMLYYPRGIAIDASGNLYIADTGNHCIRKVTSEGVISTVAGNGTFGYSGDSGPATSALLRSPTSVAMDAAGSLFIADEGNNRIRKVTSEGMISTVAGNGTQGYDGDDGPATSAMLYYPSGVAVDTSGNLYIADRGNHRIRMVTLGGTINTVAGTDTGCGYYSGDGIPATSAKLCGPVGIGIDVSGRLYIADSGHDRIRSVSSEGIISTVAGNGTYGYAGDGGPATSALLSAPYSVAVDETGNLFVADLGNDRIRKVTPGGTISTAAGTGLGYFGGDGGPATLAWLNNPQGVALDASGNLYIAGDQRVRRVNSEGIISTVAGTGTAGYSGDGGPATSALLNNPSGVAVDTAGNLYIADCSNHCIRKVTSGGVISTVAGTGVGGFSGDEGPATSAQLYWPSGVAVDATGNLYIADSTNHRIRKVTFEGIISTVAGTDYGFDDDGRPATDRILYPWGVAVDPWGYFYIVERDRNRIRMVTPDNEILTIAGNGSQGYGGDGNAATSGQLLGPISMAVDRKGNLYIADTGNQRIRKVRVIRSKFLLDRDGKTDAAVWRPGSGVWYGLSSRFPGAYASAQWGISSDWPTAGDYDGDFMTDISVWRPSTGVWHTLTGTVSVIYTSIQWGLDTDIPVPNDYDGDGRDDVAVWRPETGTWHVLLSGRPGVYSFTQWGMAGDIPVPGDYDGDGMTDFAVWRPNSGTWYVVLSSESGTYIEHQWGISSDIPVPADYDGDGRTDIAVWRKDSGTWYILPSSEPAAFTATQWGVAADVPVSGDYDGDGKADIAVWRPGEGMWYALPSASPGSYTATQWGLASDFPITPLTGILRSIP